MSETITDQGVSVQVYRTPTRRRVGKRVRTWPAYTVAWRFDGRRHRKKFAEKLDAVTFAKQEAERIGRGAASQVTLIGEDVRTWQRMKSIATRNRITPGLMLDQFETADRNLQGTGKTIVEASAEAELRHRTASGRSIAEIVQDMLAVKAGLGRDPDYLRNLRQQLGRFAAAFECPLDRVQAADLQRWLLEIPGSARTRVNYFSAVRELVTFARGRGDVPPAPAWDEVAAVRLPETLPGVIQPYSPEELGLILGHAEEHAPRWLPYLPIRAFTGIRFKEMHRLTAAAFNLRGRCIAMDPSVTKTHQRRLVPISGILATWLRRYPVGETIAPHPAGSLAPRLVELVRAAGVRPRRNGLRDSFASYRMALTGDAAKVAQECGHSPAMLARSYREIRLGDGRFITGRLARRWFGICPNSVPTRALLVNF